MKKYFFITFISLFLVYINTSCIKGAMTSGISCTQDDVSYYIEGPDTIELKNIEELDNYINSNYTIKQTTVKCKNGYLETLDNISTITINENINITKENTNLYKLTYKNYSKTITITLLEDTSSPIIETTSPLTIITDINDPINIESLLQTISATDNYDGDVAVNIKSDNYSINKNRTGTYKIVLSASDSSNNETELLLTIIVKDITSPIIYINDEILLKDIVLTEEELISIIARNNNINYVSYSIIENKYSSNKTTSGEYPLSINYKLEDESIVSLTTKIKVDYNKKKHHHNYILPISIIMCCIIIKKRMANA